MKFYRDYRKVFCLVLVVFLTFLTSCSCTGSNKPKNSYAKSETTKNKIEWVNEQIKNKSTEKIDAKKAELELLNQTITEEEILQLTKEAAIEIVEGYVDYEAVVYKKKFQYQADILELSIVPQYIGYIENATISKDTDTQEGSAWVAAATYVQSCTGASNKSSRDMIELIEGDTDNDSKDNINDIVCAFVLRVDETTTTQETEPIRFYTGKAFWSHLFNNLLVFPLAWLIYQISRIFGGFYIIGLFVITVLVRTIAWPIYAKTNDMSLKMSLMQPELQAIQEKYATRQDERSKQMQQMEMAQLYKKYKVGIGGCLMPFLQFPIFMAIYRAVSRIPYTVAYAGTVYSNNWANELNPNCLGINLFEDRTGGTGQMVGIIILMVIVVGTQFLSQWLSQRRQKKNQDAAQADIPAYRRKSYEQTKNSSQTSMKMMMYMMMLMMGLFVFTSKAGLGVYWCIGNLYSILQMEINHRTSAKRLEKLKKNI